MRRTTTGFYPGEPQGSDHVDDAAHWLAVYTELTQFLNISEPSLPRTMERYQQRLAFWQQRLHELNGQSGLTPESSP